MGGQAIIIFIIFSLLLSLLPVWQWKVYTEGTKPVLQNKSTT